MSRVERLYTECPKCGARGGCRKHGLSPTGIDWRARGNRTAQVNTQIKGGEPTE